MRLRLEEMELITTYLSVSEESFVEHCEGSGMSERDARRLISRLADDFSSALDLAFNEERENERINRNN